MPTANIATGSPWQIRFPLDGVGICTQYCNGATNIKDIGEFVEKRIAEEAKKHPEGKIAAHDKPWAITEGANKLSFIDSKQLELKFIELADGRWLTTNLAQKLYSDRAEVAPFWAGVNDLHVEALLEIGSLELTESEDDEN